MFSFYYDYHYFLWFLFLGYKINFGIETLRYFTAWLFLSTAVEQALRRIETP